jgi:hypothetical protein
MDHRFGTIFFIERRAIEKSARDILRDLWLCIAHARGVAAKPKGFHGRLVTTTSSV